MAYNNGLTPQPMYPYMMTRSLSNPHHLTSLTPAQAAIHAAESALEQVRNESMILEAAQNQARSQAHAVNETPMKGSKRGKGKVRGKGRGKDAGKTNASNNATIAPGRGKQVFSELTPSKNDKKQVEKRKKGSYPSGSRPPKNSKSKNSAQDSVTSIDNKIKSAIQVELAKQSQSADTEMNDNLNKDIEKTVINDVFIGPYNDVLHDEPSRKLFSASIKKFTKNPQLINVNDANFTPKSLDENVQVRHIYLKIDSGWFSKDIETAKSTSVAGNRSEEASKYVAHVLIHDKIKNIVDKVINAYSPTGVIFIIVSSYDVVSAFIASYAMMNGYVVIQFNSMGRNTLDEVEEEKRAGIFGYRIGQVATIYHLYSKEVVKDTKTKEDTVYSL